MDYKNAHRLALKRAKLIRALQVLKFAHDQGRIIEKRYRKHHEKYLQKLRKIDELRKDEGAIYGMVHSHMDLPTEIEKKPAGETSAEPYRIFGGMFLKIAIGILAFFLVGYFIQFANNQGLVYVAIAIACPLLYLFIAYQFDRYEPEPKHFVAGVFIWGMLAGVPALWINSMALNYISITALVCMAGFSEELTKGIGLFKLSRHPEFNDPIDGILYGVAAGLGFAAFENLCYFANFSMLIKAGLLSSTEAHLSIALRSTLSALGHASFTGMLGLFLARAKLKNGFPTVYNFLFAYLVAAVLHGLFNATITFASSAAPGLIGILVIGCMLYFWHVIKKSWKNRSFHSYTISSAR